MTWKSILTIVELLLGFAFLYVRFLLYESEEGALQSGLTLLWVRIEERARIARARATHLVRAAACHTLRIYDCIFGPRLFSAKAIVIAIALGVASTLLLNGFNLYMNPHDLLPQDGNNAQGEATLLGVPCHELVQSRLQWSFLGGILGLMSASLPILFPKSRAALAYALAPTIIIVMASWVEAWLVSHRPAQPMWLETWASIEADRQRERVAASINTLFHFSIAPLALLLCVAGTRETLRRSTWSLSWKCVAVCASLILAVACTHFTTQLNQDLLYEDRLTLKWFAWSIAVAAMDTQLLATVLSLAYSAVMCLAVTCMLLWPFLSRVTYAAERTRLFQQSKVLTTVGMALVVHAGSRIGWLMDALKSLSL